MTQPAASKMLRELEAASNCTLLERVCRSLKVTTAGRTALPHLAAVRGALEDLLRGPMRARGRGDGRALGRN